jgi:hypothetical protein
MLDARRNVICTSAHIGKSLVSVAYPNVEPRCYFCRKGADGCALYIAFGIRGLSNMLRPVLDESGAYLLVTHRNIGQRVRAFRRPINGLLQIRLPTENPRVAGSIPPLATSQPSTDFYTRLQKPCFIGFYCIPLSADVPSNHPQLPVCGGCFRGHSGVHRRRAQSACVGRVVAPRKAAAPGRRSKNKPIPPFAHAFQRFTIGSTSISDRSTFRGTEHAASLLIHG